MQVLKGSDFVHLPCPFIVPGRRDISTWLCGWDSESLGEDGTTCRSGLPFLEDQMKKIDYLCILYCIALLAFGFDDKSPSTETKVSSRMNRLPARTIENQTATIQPVAMHSGVALTKQSLIRVRLKK